MVEIWHIPRCSKSRRAMELNTGAGIEPEVRRWIDAMVAHPRLIERPVVIADGRAVLGRPPTDVESLL